MELTYLNNTHGVLFDKLMDQANTAMIRSDLCFEICDIVLETARATAARKLRRLFKHDPSNLLLCKLAISDKKKRIKDSALLPQRP